MVAQYDGVIRELIESTTALKLDVASICVQEPVENKPGRSIIVDALCREKDGTIWNVEIQNAPRGALIRRARFYADLITARSLGEGRPDSDVPNINVIFITDCANLVWTSIVCLSVLVLGASNVLQTQEMKYRKITVHSGVQYGRR